MFGSQNLSSRACGTSSFRATLERVCNLGCPSPPRSCPCKFNTGNQKYIAPFVSLIHGIDSLKLLKIINKEGEKNNRVIDCLLQIHIAKESSKFGLDKDELIALLESDEFKSLENIRIVGLMGMATFSKDTDLIRNEFKYLKNCFTDVKNNYFYSAEYFAEISMGMSDDYPIAIEEGSTMVRIGSSIFGARNY